MKSKIMRYGLCALLVVVSFGLIVRNDLIETLLVITGTLFLMPVIAEISLWIFTSVQWAHYDNTDDNDNHLARSIVIGSVYLTTGLVTGLLMLAVYFLQWSPTGEVIP